MRKIIAVGVICSAFIGILVLVSFNTHNIRTTSRVVRVDGSKNETRHTVARSNTVRDTKPVPQISRSITYTTHQTTAYTWTGHRTASGQYPVEGRTIAINPVKFHLGQRIYIVGHGWRIAEDLIPPRSVAKGADIDLYMGRGTEAEKKAKEHGRRMVRTYVYR